MTHLVSRAVVGSLVTDVRLTGCVMYPSFDLFGTCIFARYEMRQICINMPSDCLGFIYCARVCGWSVLLDLNAWITADYTPTIGGGVLHQH